MTRTQYRRMRTFALRMATVAIGGARWQAEVRAHVSELTYRLSQPNWCHYSTIRDYCTPEPTPGDDGTVGFALRHPRPILCDAVADYLWNHRLLYEKEFADGSCEIIESKRANAIECCIRAGCDLATEGDGVLGFTAGDLRRMWPKRRTLPAWISRQFTEANLDNAADSDLLWL